MKFNFDIFLRDHIQNSVLDMDRTSGLVYRSSTSAKFAGPANNGQQNSNNERMQDLKNDG